MNRFYHHAISAAGIALLTVVPPANTARAQTIEVTPPGADSVSGAPRVRLLGFPAGTEVEVSFTRTPPNGKPPSFRSTARYRTGTDGTVNVANAPVSGDWTLALPEAPYWTMHPEPTAPLLRPEVVLIEAKGGSISRRAEYRMPAAPAVTVEPVTAFPGAFIARPPNATGPLPLVIVLGGSDGDDHTARFLAPRFAAEGFAVLGLPYISPDRGKGQAIPGLPSVFSNVPVDQLQAVHRWASSDPRIDVRRIGLWGISKGGEFAVLAAAHYRWIDAVAAIVPSDVVWEGFSYSSPAGTGAPSFTLNGKPLAFVPYSAPGRGRDVKEAGRRADPKRAAAARIPIERFTGALLVAGGELDESWNSAGMSQSIAERRAEAGRMTVSLIFPDVGHDLLGAILEPMKPSAGSTAEAQGRAKLRTWSATLDLFKRALLGAAKGGESAR